MSEAKIPVSFLLHDLPLQPEERLLHGILWRALKDLVCSEQKDKRDAFAYILSDLCEDTEWSFRWVCKQVNLNPNKLVAKICMYEEKIEECDIYELLFNR